MIKIYPISTENSKKTFSFGNIQFTESLIENQPIVYLMNQLPNLLIVDDTVENILLLKTIVQNVQVNLIQAYSGFEALERTRGIELALAIIDVKMPGMDGYELARRMNKERLGDTVPIIFLTAGDEKNAFEGYDSGAVDYLNKPVPNHILLSKIKVFIDLFNQKQIIITNIELLKKSADELSRTNEALRKREEKLQQEQLFNKALLDSIPGIFYLYTYPELRMVTWNKQHETLFGFEPEEMEGRHVLEWHSSETHEAVLNSLDGFMDTGQAGIEANLLAKDGHSIPFLLTAVKLESQGQNYLIGIGTDIQKRKKAEEELKSSLEQLKQLSQHIEKARENERKAISRELHDDLGQALTAVKIDLGIIKQNVSDNEVIQKINKVSALVGETIKTVQRLTSQLRPEIIDDLGLEAAIKWYTKEFAQRNGIEIDLEMDSGIPISPDDSLILFRIMQESLTNIARHSGANRIDIKLIEEDDLINFMISDNGIGITKEELSSNKSFGIIGMKERATSLAGTCDIYSENGNGTIINLIFPLNKMDV